MGKLTIIHLVRGAKYASSFNVSQEYIDDLGGLRIFVELISHNRKWTPLRAIRSATGADSEIIEDFVDDYDNYKAKWPPDTEK